MLQIFPPQEGVQLRTLARTDIRRRIKRLVQRARAAAATVPRPNGATEK